MRGSKKRKLLFIGDFLYKGFNDLVEGRTSVVVLNEKALGMTKVPLIIQSDPYIEWYLHKDWFKMVVVQVLGPDHSDGLRGVFKEVGWDYDKAFSPEYSDTTTIETFQMSEIFAGALDVRLLLVTKIQKPIGSSWRDWTVVATFGTKRKLEHNIYAGISLLREVGSLC